MGERHPARGARSASGAWRITSVPAATETSASATPAMRSVVPSIFAAQEAQSIPVTRNRL